MPLFVRCLDEDNCFVLVVGSFFGGDAGARGGFFKSRGGGIVPESWSGSPDK